MVGAASFPRGKPTSGRAFSGRPRLGRQAVAGADHCTREVAWEHGDIYFRPFTPSSHFCKNAVPPTSRLPQPGPGELQLPRPGAPEYALPPNSSP